MILTILTPTTNNHDLDNGYEHIQKHEQQTHKYTHSSDEKQSQISASNC